MLINPMLSKAHGSEYVYAKTTVNIRASPNTKSKIVGRVYWNDKLKIIKKVNKKWYLIRYKKSNRYICSKYVRKNKINSITYKSPTKGNFKSYEDSDCITDSTLLPQGRIKKKYKLDKTGIYMIGNRYCIAIGSYYTKNIGVKVDLVLSRNGRKHTLKCITADSKADIDTINNHRVHRDGSVVEFVVNTDYISKKVMYHGDVSYAAKKFKGNITKIKVYKK